MKQTLVTFFPSKKVAGIGWLCFTLLAPTACGQVGNPITPEATLAATAVAATDSFLSASTPTASAGVVEETDGTAGINGRVWHDICINQDEAAEGCLKTSNGSYQANGMLDDNEPGLTDILVRLGSGECPNISTESGTVLGMSDKAIAATATDGNGEFVFVGLSAGTYCLMINPLDEPNRNLLLPGNWTSESKGLQTIELASGETKTSNFGWDFEFLPISAAALNCRDNAEFVNDVTIPDDTIIAAGAIFTKTWRIRNVGTCDWTPAYALTFVDGFELEGPKTIPITRTIAPTNTVDFTVALMAPVISGTFRADWQIYNANKREFFGVFGDEPIWVQIVVEEPAERTADAPPTLSPTVTVTATFTATVISTPLFQNAALSGLIWEDSNADGNQGDSESPLRSLTISLYSDECPSTQLISTQMTNVGGGYVFTNLAPGTYCISVAANTPENISILSSGSWVFPEEGAGSLTVTLQSGENLTDINFGWQFEEE